MPERRERETPAQRRRLLDPTARLIRYLESKNGILLLTTSTRFEGHPWDVPKTTQLALRIRDHLRKKRKRVTRHRRREAQDPHLRGQHQRQTRQRLRRARGKAARPREEPDRPAPVLGLDQQRGRPALQDQPRAVPLAGRGLLRLGALGTGQQRLPAALRAAELDREPVELARSRSRSASCASSRPASSSSATTGTTKRCSKRRSRISSGSAGRRPPPLSFCWQYTQDAEEESLRVLPRCRPASSRRR